MNLPDDVRAVLDGGRQWAVVQGDCLEVLPLLPTGCVDMIWTDPPFGHGNQDGDLQASRVRDQVKGARVRMAEPIANDAGPDFEAVLKGFLDGAARVLNRDCCCCCCMAGGGPTVTFARVSQWVDERLAFFMAVVWDKSDRGNGMGWRYRRNYEFVLVAHRKGGSLLWADDSRAVPNIFRDLPVIKRVHPNEKPISLISKFIKLHTQPGDLILDPFAGSFTTGVACVQTGRRFIGVEIDAGYCEIGRARLDKASVGGPLFKAEQASLFPV